MSSVLISLLTMAALAGPPCDKAYNLETGVAATCNGVLWPAPWTVEALRLKQVLLPTCNADLTLCVAQKTIETDALQLKLDAANTMIGEQRRLLDIAIDNATPTPWYKTMAFWIPTAAVAALAIGFGAGYASADFL